MERYKQSKCLRFHKHANRRYLQPGLVARLTHKPSLPLPHPWFPLRSFQKLGAKTLRTFHEAAGSAAGGPQRGPSRTPMRLSYYGGGHYDSVAQLVDSPPPAGVVLPPVVEAARAADAGGAAASPDASASGTAAGAAGAVVPAPEPGQLEDAALERSRRRAAEAGSGR